MKFSATPEEELSINLTPLIDIVFLLLIFFMVSTTFDKESRLELALPKASPSQSDSRGPASIILAIDVGGGYQLGVETGNRESEFRGVAPDELKPLLIQAIEQYPDGGLLIKADARTTHQSVIFALDAARHAGIKKVTFAAKITDQ